MTNPIQREKARLRAKAYYWAHREEILAEAKAFAAANPCSKKEYLANWYKANRIDVLKEMKEKHAANPEIGRKRANDWYAENQEHARERARQWAIDHPEERKIYNRNRRSRKNSAGGTHTFEDIKRIFKSQRGRCAYCRKSIKNGFHVDHIIPICKGGSNWPNNIQLTCDKCNLQKHTADPVDFARKKNLLI